MLPVIAKDSTLSLSDITQAQFLSSEPTGIPAAMDL